jgi:hypothetical protein
VWFLGAPVSECVCTIPLLIIQRMMRSTGTR